MYIDIARNISIFESACKVLQYFAQKLYISYLVIYDNRIYLAINFYRASHMYAVRTYFLKTSEKSVFKFPCGGSTSTSYHTSCTTNLSHGKIIRHGHERVGSLLKEACWDCIFVFENINDLTNAWYKLFTSMLDEYLPQIQKLVKK